MDLLDLGFAEITPEKEDTIIQKYSYEYEILLQRQKNGEITKEEWFDLLIELTKKYDITINPRLLTIPWVSKYLKSKTEKSLK